LIIALCKNLKLIIKRLPLFILKHINLQYQSGMNIKEIKKHNPQSFLDDLKRVREVMVYAECTNSHYRILKKDLLRTAERQTIKYYITRDIFVMERDVMVVI
jgi:hypothetical protein